MDGTNLPVLVAPPAHAAAGSAASASGPVAGLRDSFAAILGATELTGLSADQQAALRQLLGSPADTLRPAAEAVGNALPQAAIRGLLGALGVVLDPQAQATEAAVAPTGAAAPARPTSAAEGGGELAAILFGMLRTATLTSDLRAPGVGAAVSASPEEEGVQSADAPAEGADLAATLLVLLTQGGAATAAQVPRAEPATSDGGTAKAGDGLVPDPASPLDAILAATGAAATVVGAAAEDERPVAIDALWAMIRHAGRSAGAADAVQRAAVDPDGTPAMLRNGDSASVPAAFLAALQSVAAEDGVDAPPVADLTRGLATALDAVGAAAARSGFASAPEFVPARAAALVNDAVSVPVGERGWDRAFGERVLWLVGQQVQAAEVKLNPPHLGPVEVRLSLTGQDASVSFTVAHGATRDAIEQAIPRLRELFAQHQLQIVNVDVGQRDASSQASHGDRSGHGGTASAGGAARSAAIAAEPVVVARQGSVSGLVDEYA
jgi:hypothetical protein